MPPYSAALQLYVAYDDNDGREWFTESDILCAIYRSRCDASTPARQDVQDSSSITARRLFFPTPSFAHAAAADAPPPLAYRLMPPRV